MFARILRTREERWTIFPFFLQRAVFRALSTIPNLLLFAAFARSRDYKDLKSAWLTGLFDGLIARTIAYLSAITTGLPSVFREDYRAFRCVFENVLLISFSLPIRNSFGLVLVSPFSSLQRG